MDVNADYKNDKASIKAIVEATIIEGDQNALEKVYSLFG